jgi:hypothetical protein
VKTSAAIGPLGFFDEDVAADLASYQGAVEAMMEEEGTRARARATLRASLEGGEVRASGSFVLRHDHGSPEVRDTGVRSSVDMFFEIEVCHTERARYRFSGTARVEASPETFRHLFFEELQPYSRSVVHVTDLLEADSYHETGGEDEPVRIVSIPSDTMLDEGVFEAGCHEVTGIIFGHLLWPTQDALRSARASSRGRRAASSASRWSWRRTR